MPFERRQLGASGRVPELDCIVPAAGDERLIVLGEGGHLNRLGVALQGEELLARVRVPDPDLLVQPLIKLGG